MALYRLLMCDPAPAPAAAPVLLLHGVLCNAGALRGLRTDLVARGIGPVYVMSYGPPLLSIENFADQVAAKVDAIFRAKPAPRALRSSGTAWAASSPAPTFDVTAAPGLRR